ncbi:unnamed protein product [Cyprideis torosa]|uniref:26S proteasome non-ATPase regulatory subunit 2 n=1 Tax=Cyprideis torosa TaxID=163714 RepID=A0A7R8W0I0_9CRUS|nr:unnamed protein product [Cyprideis torosa]CAG0879784.1 unnamed protein product [Cyprideis torosa]
MSSLTLLMILGLLSHRTCRGNEISGRPIVDGISAMVDYIFRPPVPHVHEEPILDVCYFPAARLAFDVIPTIVTRLIFGPPPKPYYYTRPATYALGDRCRCTPECLLSISNSVCDPYGYCSCAEGYEGYVGQKICTPVVADLCSSEDGVQSKRVDMTKGGGRSDEGVPIKIPRTDPEKPPEDPHKKENERKLSEVEKKLKEATIGKKDDKKKEDEMSEEDKELQEQLNMLVERLSEPDEKLYRQALESMRSLIRASTTSMTSVPKPLKFMIPHYEKMKEIHDKIKDTSTQRFCADIISVLAMTIAEGRECLGYRLKGSDEPIGDWGHEYVRHLAGEIAAEWAELPEGVSERHSQLEKLVDQIVPYQMIHNAEAEACDLLMETDRLQTLLGHVDESAYPRVCLYLTSCVPYVPDPENTVLLKTALTIFRKFKQHPQALRIAMMLNDTSLIEEIFNACEDPLMQRQLAYMLGRQMIFVDSPDEDLVEIMSNRSLNESFLSLARELDIMEPKSPEDIYKSHLENTRPSFGGSQVDSARQNLAASFVNGFVNCGFGKDKLLIEDGNAWFHKNKEHGKLSAAASLGLILLWDVDSGLTQIDKYLYATDDYIKAGALLACGIVSSGVRDECDPALALLSDYVGTTSSKTLQIGAILGLGLAYAGSNRPGVLEHFLPILSNWDAPMEIVGLAALSCGLVAVGSCNSDVSEAILQSLMDRDKKCLEDPFAKFLPLGIALCYLGQQNQADTTLMALEVLPQPFRGMAMTLVEICAYAGTGNVLKVQELLLISSQHYESHSSDKDSKDKKKEEKKSDEKKTDDKSKGSTSAPTAGSTGATTSAEAPTPMETDQGASTSTAETPKKKDEDEGLDFSSQQVMAVLGIALISMGEDIGSEKCGPTGHGPVVRAGTNNARLAAMLRQLAQYHAKDPSSLFIVRIAQGLVHLGKGTMTLHPYHSDRTLLSPVAVAGILATMVAATEMKNTILGKAHYLLYCLVTAIRPRMLITVNEKLESLPVSVRVGQAVDVVGQAGRPKTITGFQTHTTPVLLSHGERAELATDEYLSLTPILEGFVILRPNPDAEPREDKTEPKTKK